MKLRKALSLLLCLILMTSIAIIPDSASAGQSNNPLIKGSYADPDIDYFDCKFWMYPTTDGVIDNNSDDGWWASTTFKAFSSEDMINWTDHGVILDVAADTAEQAGVNEYGVQIAYSPWSFGHAWAPSIEKRGNMYYFYYVAAVKPELFSEYCVWVDEGVGENGEPKGHYLTDNKAIGVAYSNSPTGPFTALSEPIITPKMVYDVFGADSKIPNVIDPSIFIDSDNTPYMLFGNSVACSVKLNDDMISIDKSTIRAINSVPIPDSWVGDYTWDDTGRVGWKVINGIPKRTNPSYGRYEDFSESIVVFKKDGLYYFTWSVNGTDSEDYKVAYSTSKNLFGNGSYQGVLLEKDKSQHILSTGHQSILHYPIDDTYYICYGRYQVDSNGNPVERAENHREVCLDKIEFADLYTLRVKPTNTGIGYLSSHNYRLAGYIEPSTTEGSRTYKCDICSKTYTEYIPAIAQPVVETTTNAPATTTKQEATAKKPSTPKSLKVKSEKKKATVTFAKVSGVTGYQLQYSTDKNFKKGTKTVTLKGQKKTSTTINKLKSKKTYYVRVRAYKTTKGKSSYSSWTAKKIVKVK